MADDNTGSWMDFAQRSRDDGGLGLERHQAAGVVGNLQNESGSGIPAWGPTGDNGTAWGSAQWRGDRLNALRDHAESNGLDYRSPEAQQSFMRHEFDTSENGAYQAIQAAQTPEAAAAAMDARYERSDGSTRNQRINSARRLYAGSDGPTAIDAAMGRTSSPAGSKMAYAAPDDEEATPTAAPPALSAAATLGPGALGANPAAAAKPSWLDTLGQTLMNMAPGIAQDPAHAAALGQVAAAQQKAATQGSWSTSFDPKTGMATQTNSATGNTRQFKYATPTKDDKKWGITKYGPDGKPVYGYEPSEEEYAAQQLAAKNAPPALDASGLTGQPFLDAIDTTKGAKYVNRVKAIAEGREDLPVGRAAMEGTPGGDLVNDVQTYDNKFEKGNALARSNLRKSFETSTAPNSPAVQLRMGNVALEHGANLSDEIEAVKAYHDHADSLIPGVSYGLNYAHNKALAGQSTPESQAYSALQTHINNFASEKAKFLGGGVAGEHEKSRVLALYDMNKSLPELRAGMAADAEDVKAKGGELLNGWRTGNNNSPLVPDFPVISKEGQAGYDRIIERHNRTKDGGYVQPGSGAAAPASGLKGRQPLSDIFK